MDIVGVPFGTTGPSGCPAEREGDVAEAPIVCTKPSQRPSLICRLCVISMAPELYLVMPQRLV